MQLVMNAFAPFLKTVVYMRRKYDISNFTDRQAGFLVESI